MAPRMSPTWSTRPGVRESLGTTPCICTDPKSGSGTSTMS